MEKLLKNTFYTVVGVFLLGLNTVNAAIGFGKDKVGAGLKGADDQADTAIQRLISNFMMFLALIAVVYLLWGGFNILTAGGDEKKVTTGKTIIIQAGIGLVVIYLANSVVQWVISSLLGS